MDVEFSDRANWRGAGRPRAAADPDVVALVRRTHLTGTFATLRVEPGTPLADIGATLRELRRAAEQAGMRLHIQPRTQQAILGIGFVRFYGEPKSE